MIRWFVNYETLDCTEVDNECAIEWLLKYNFQEVDKTEYNEIKALVEDINAFRFDLKADMILRKMSQ